MSGSKGAGRSGWASSDDYTFLSLIIITIGLGVGGCMLWSLHHAEVVEAVATVQLWKMSALARVTRELDGLSQLVAHARYPTVTFAELMAMCGIVNAVVRVPAAGLIAALALVCLVWAPPARFKRKLDLEGLAREQASFFRAAGAYLGRGLRLVPLGDSAPRPADPALHAHEWVARLPEIKEAEPPAQEGTQGEAKRIWTKRKTSGTPVYDAAKVTKGLIAQLGPVWRGAAAARPPARIMFAAISLHLEGRREECLTLLGDLAEALAADGEQGPAGPERPLEAPPDVVATADAVISDGNLRIPAESAARQHAFETTALMGLLNLARLNNGVLAPPQFNGLKLMDRNLWYALHSLGFPGHGPGQNSHPNPRVEAIGARAHWENERQARCALFNPEISSALHAVRAAIEQHRMDQEEQT